MLKKISILGLLLLNAKVSIGSEAAAGGPCKSPSVKEIVQRLSIDSPSPEIFEGLDATLFSGNPRSVVRYESYQAGLIEENELLARRKLQASKDLIKKQREQALFEREHRQRLARLQEIRQFNREWRKLPKLLKESSSEQAVSLFREPGISEEELDILKYRHILRVAEIDFSSKK